MKMVLRKIAYSLTNWAWREHHGDWFHHFAWYPLRVSTNKLLAPNSGHRWVWLRWVWYHPDLKIHKRAPEQPQRYWWSNDYPDLPFFGER